MVTSTRQWWHSNEFRDFLPWISASGAGDKRHFAHPRFEVKSNTPWLTRQAMLDYRVPCVACGSLMAPFRQRKGSRHPYFAVTCDQDRNNACSRGRKATDAYDEIWRMIRDSEPPQGSLL